MFSQVVPRMQSYFELKWCYTLRWCSYPEKIKDTCKTLVVSDEHKLAAVGNELVICEFLFHLHLLLPLKSHNPALTPHVLGLYPNTVPGGSIQNNIPFDAFMVAQINPCMICSNDTYLLIWRNALIFWGDFWGKLQSRITWTPKSPVQATHVD